MNAATTVNASPMNQTKMFRRPKARTGPRRWSTAFRAARLPVRTRVQQQPIGQEHSQRGQRVGRFCRGRLNERGQRVEHHKHRAAFEDERSAVGQSGRANRGDGRDRYSADDRHPRDCRRALDQMVEPR